MNFFFVIGGMKDRENPAFGGLFQNFHRLLQTSIHSRSIVLVELLLFLSGHLVEQIIGGDSHTFQLVALCILGKRERHVEVEVAWGEKSLNREEAIRQTQNRVSCG